MDTGLPRNLSMKQYYLQLSTDNHHLLKPAIRGIHSSYIYVAILRGRYL